MGLLVGSLKGTPFSGSKPTKKIVPAKEGLLSTQKAIGRRIGSISDGTASEDTVDTVSEKVGQNWISSKTSEMLANGGHDSLVVDEASGMLAEDKVVLIFKISTRWTKGAFLGCTAMKGFPSRKKTMYPFDVKTEKASIARA